MIYKNSSFIFSGKIDSIDSKTIQTKTGPAPLQKLTVILEEKGGDSKVYLNYWGRYKFNVNETGHFMGNITYKKVISKKATTFNGEPFEYGAFDFNLKMFSPTNKGLIQWAEKIYKEWKAPKMKHIEEDQISLDDIFDQEDEEEDNEGFIN